MARMSSLLAFATAVSVAHGHFTFIRLALNGEWQAPSRFFRNKTAPFAEPNTPNTGSDTRDYNDPTFWTDFPESIRCGRDHMAHAADTEILTVQAGDTIEVVHTVVAPELWTDAMWYDCFNGRGSCNPRVPSGIMTIIHPGPFLAHLSKVPEGESILTYDGSGEWTKIYTLGLDVNDDGSLHWLASNYEETPGRMVFKIPQQTPAGEYLLRMDLIWPGLWQPPIYVSDGAQFYATCAHILVKSNVTGSLPEGIKIPEGFNKTEPGMRTSLAMYREQSLDEGYVYPGGPLWDGEELVQDKPGA